MAIRSRADLIDYCFHQLGSPVIQIELEEQQVTYCIDNAIEVWQSIHCDGSVHRFIPHTVTQFEVDHGYLILPDKIIGVSRVVPVNAGIGSANLSGMGIFNPIYQYRLNDFWDIAKGGLSAYNDVLTNLEMVQGMLQAEISISFNRYSNKLYINNGSNMVRAGTIIVVECYCLQDDVDAPRMYGDLWLKKYATALMKRQWGSNTKKYDGVQLPGGITINGQQIYNEAIQEVAQLEAELHEEWSSPPCFFIG